MSTNDLALWERWRSTRDADALAEIITRYSGMVFSTCRRVLGNTADAEDVTQECFLELSRGTTRVRSSLGAWLHTLALHRSVDFMKTNARRHRRERQFAAEKAEVAEAPREELLAQVDRAVDLLPRKLREAIVLRFLEGRSHEACARLLGVSESTVGYRVNKGIEQVRGALKRAGLAASSVALTSALLASNDGAPAGLMASLGRIALSAPAGSGPFGPAGGNEPETSPSPNGIDSAANAARARTLGPGLALRGLVACAIVVGTVGAVASFRRPQAATAPAQARRISEYVLTPRPMWWHEAEDWAREQGGHLVAIGSQEEQDWLVRTFGGDGTLWIGLTDEDAEGNWMWTSGDRVVYTNWRAGEPNDELNTEDYVFMNFVEPGKWNDIGPTSPRWGLHFGIVEISFEE